MFRPAIKDAHRPMDLPGHRILLGQLQYGVAAEIEDDEQGTLRRLLSLMDGTRDVRAIATELSHTHPGWDVEGVRDAIGQLTSFGHVEDAGAPVPPGLTTGDVARYGSLRHYFSWIDVADRTSPYDVLARIRKARVALLGLGGTGSTVAASLVASGIGALHCADFDRVEKPNLTRQLIYSERHVGRSKVESAVEYLTALNSDVTVTGEELKAGSPADLERLATGYDVLVVCADRPADRIRAWANEAALKTGTPWFIALYAGPMALIASFVPGETACWECLDSQERKREIRAAGHWFPGDRPHAVVAGTAGVSGHLCALDVLYHLGGLPTQSRGRVVAHNLARWDHRFSIDAVLDPNCPACGPVTR
jgi:molybdopterin/thiamine biosynthesis adenylyltransferase